MKLWIFQKSDSNYNFLT